VNDLILFMVFGSLASGMVLQRFS